jgi:hypothetical protein
MFEYYGKQFVRKNRTSARQFEVLDLYCTEGMNEGAFACCEIVNVMLQVSLMSDVVAVQQSVDMAEVEFSCLPADNLRSMLAALLVSCV